MDDKQSTNAGLRELALFAGAGGGILAGHLLGWRTVCAVERDPYAASVLMQRQNDGILDPFPVWDDVCTFDGRPWRGRVDVVSGGFPCQDISVAGHGKGLDGERSGLWTQMDRIIGEVRPRLVFVENSPMLAVRGGVRVIADLAAMGYVGRWGTLGASATGSVCEGERFWVVAVEANSAVLEGLDFSQHQITYQEEPRRRQHSRAIGEMLTQDDYSRIKRDPHAVAEQMDRLKAIGNGQDPYLAKLAFTLLTTIKSERKVTEDD